MFKKVLLSFVFFMVTGCTSFEDLRPFFSSKYDCGNGWLAVTERLCEFERYGY